MAEWICRLIGHAWCGCKGCTRGGVQICFRCPAKRAVAVEIKLAVDTGVD